MSEKPQLDTDASAKLGVPDKPSSPESPQKRPSVFAESGRTRKRDEECPEGHSESEQTLLRDVSRETSERTPEQQMLYDIMDRSMTKGQEPPAGEDLEAPGPPQEEPGEEEQDAPPPPQKNKPSSFYVYLAVLFGAAFMMLLLAYFVQQRNNASVQDDLRTITASREELLAQIQELEEKRDWLQNAYDRQRAHSDDLEQQNESLHTEVDAIHQNLLQMTTWYDNAYTLDCLERFLQDRDYLMAGTVVVDSDVMFNRNTSVYTSVDTWQYLTPANEKRYLELKDELFRKSGFMILTQEGDGSGYVPGAPIIDSSAFGQEEQQAARFLWYIIREYAIAPDGAAQWLAVYYDDLQERGDQGLFKPSTMELLEEIKTDLTSQGLLTEEDGALTANVSQDGPADDIWEPLESDPTKVKLQ